MIITLKNFKCFTFAKFVFPDNTNTLITSPSGFGKTSILEAIRFVLWGNRDVDLVTIGKKKCEVILEFKDLTFIRRKNPNFFSITSEKSGTVENPTDFVDIHFPKYPTKFIEYSSIRQMQILETISSNNKNIEEIKEHLKNIISQGNKKYSEIDIEIKILKNTIDKFPTVDVSSLEEPINSSEYSVEYCKSKIKDLKNEEKKMLSENAIVKTIKQELDTLYVKVPKFLPKNKNPKTVYDDLIKQQNELEMFNAKKAELQGKIIMDQKETVSGLESRIYKAKTDKSHLDNSRKTIERILFSNQELVDKSIQDLQLMLEQQNLTSTLNCPTCSSILEFKDNKLCLYSDKNVVKDLYDSLQSVKSITNEDIHNIHTLNEELFRIKLSKESEMELKELNEVTKKKVNKNTSQIMENISELKHYITAIDRQKLLEEKLINYNNYSEEEFMTINEKISEYEKISSDNMAFIDKHNMWKHNKNIHDLKISYENDLKNKLEAIYTVGFLIQKIETLKKIIEECHSKSLTSLINLINKELRVFCQSFFVDDLVVKIEKFKQIQSTKSIKPCIDIVVTYKGSKTKLDNLSTGEYARVELAMDIVLYKLSGSNCPLLLDEVTANLDSDTSSMIFNNINKYFQNTTILTVAHQAVEGVFDNVVTEETLRENCQKM